MKRGIKCLLAALVVSLVLVNTHAHDIANAGQFKPGIKTPRIKVRPPVIKPRIKVRPPNVTPHTQRLIKKNTLKEITNPAAPPGGFSPGADFSAGPQARSAPPLPPGDEPVIVVEEPADTTDVTPETTQTDGDRQGDQEQTN